MVGRLFAANAIPHFVAGITGQTFQTPFAKPMGEGLSSSTVNFVWGIFKAVIGYLLIYHVGEFALRNTGDIIASGIGFLSLQYSPPDTLADFTGGARQHSRNRQFEKSQMASNVMATIAKGGCQKRLRI